MMATGEGKRRMTPPRPASPPPISRQLAAGLPDGSIRTGASVAGVGADEVTPLARWFGRRTRDWARRS